MRTILLTEDEPGIRDTIRVVLESEGFKMISAMTGKECLSLLKESPDLLVLDVGLPDGNGFEILKELRKKNSIPVILLTARESELDRVLGLELGADDYMVKPFSPRELVARIKAVLRRYDGSSEKKRTEFLTDEDRKIIYYYGKSLTLTPYEYKTLLLFLKRPGKIFTREEIMDSVWTEPEESFDRAVDTVIKNIRSRLKEIRPDTDPIETRRAQGYGLKEIV
ncbi:response regulator [Leptospira borgpetersenii]|uniref:Sensor protein of a two-component response regulator n=2 Tax=Leptospira borgpetersenii serovar Hardjo-bovis TaxID=338217 RepID=Q04RI7_LEPBJ|nr:response regulator [Leptospira borgpetersenii]ABJ76483.1 Sensor protein of a two-component response regulator [Leptospira borgpetersenii serovar Hardjo-bovis str. JB197]ABJ78811.1 Sensor protein of a two-component response regulator [Leptospira borgpetersenii serovar Hardjo-bovis str. L550]AMX58086.1 transcriptional regulator [Leptospira borgpetersenii serovar Hardjo]AMX61338.1 transcriptional regulator [Leptospira borgpetersenii serovar Hardjo]AMX64583.1 transcriptional regulator [Leptospi